MTITRSQSRDSLQRALEPFDALSLGRPAWMLLPDYLSQLRALELLSSQDARALLQVYERACYGASGVDQETWEACLAPLRDAQAKAELLPKAQRLAWLEQFTRTPQPEAPADAPSSEAPESPAQEPPFALPNVLRPPRRESSDVEPQQSHGSAQAKASPSTAPPPPSSANAAPRRIGLSPRLIAGLVVLFILCVGVSLWIGAKNYEDVIGIRYRIGNSIARSLDLPRSPLPARYSYRAVTRRKRRLERWLRWWRTQRPLFHIRRHYRRQLRRDPTPSRSAQQTMWSRLARAHSEEDSYVYAIFFFEKAVALLPNDPELLNDYAWMLTQTKDPLFRNPRRALALAERSFRLKRRHYIADTLAIAAAQRGQFQRAIRLSRWALQYAPEDDKEDYEEQLESVLKMAKAAKATIPPKDDILKLKPTPRPTTRARPSQPASRPTSRPAAR